MSVDFQIFDLGSPSFVYSPRPKVQGRWPVTRKEFAVYPEANRFERVPRFRQKGSNAQQYAPQTVATASQFYYCGLPFGGRLALFLGLGADFLAGSGPRNRPIGP
jgi:hypothetical protein